MLGVVDEGEDRTRPAHACCTAGAVQVEGRGGREVKVEYRLYLREVDAPCSEVRAHK